MPLESFQMTYQSIKQITSLDRDRYLINVSSDVASHSAAVDCNITSSIEQHINRISLDTRYAQLQSIGFEQILIPFSSLIVVSRVQLVW